MTLLVAPEGAKGVESLMRDDGTMLFKWFDLKRGESWSLTSSADRRTVNVQVRHYYDSPTPEMPEVLEVLRWVFQYSSGRNVDIEILADGAA